VSTGGGREVLVKICGVTRAEDAEAAAAAGADLVGLNFWPRSRRHVSVAQALEIAAALPGDVKKVGVFVNQPAPLVLDVAARVGLDLIQLHGDEDSAYASALGRAYVRALRVGRSADLRAAADFAAAAFLLLDAPSSGYGGSGTTFDWALAEEARQSGLRFLLAGGLGPDNVAGAVRQVRPLGVDVAGGVESAPGIKDHALMRRFVDAAKGTP
jgi:phosphoribosylanthranilate isomerase